MTLSSRVPAEEVLSFTQLLSIACSELPELKFPKFTQLFGTFWFICARRCSKWIRAIDSSRWVRIIFGAGHPQRLSIREVRDVQSRLPNQKINEDHWFSTMISLVSRPKMSKKSMKIRTENSVFNSYVWSGLEGSEWKIKETNARNGEPSMSKRAPYILKFVDSKNS